VSDGWHRIKIKEMLAKKILRGDAKASRAQNFFTQDDKMCDFAGKITHFICFFLFFASKK